MEDTDRQEWSRHYDSVHWTQISVFTGVAAGLLAFSLDKEFNPWLSALGLWVTNLTVWLTASFREYRRELTDAIQDEDLRRFLCNAHEPKRRSLRMWPIFVLTFLFMDFIWLKGYWAYGNQALSAILTIASLVLLAFVAYHGRTPQYPKKPQAPASALESRGGPTKG